MVDQRAMLNLALQKCRDPKMRDIIQKNFNNPSAIVQELCQAYPEIASRIDASIGQNQNPETIVKNMLGIKF